jgi:hypothetical protein
VPDDPFDAQPLRLVRRPDGVTIRAIGDGTGSSNLVPYLGFRLWDPKQRRQLP